MSNKKQSGDFRNSKTYQSQRPKTSQNTRINTSNEKKKPNTFKERSIEV
jgi:hypothetical protein